MLEAARALFALLPAAASWLLFSAVASAQPAASRPSFVLVSVDTLRADHLGCYGYPRATAPAIDRLASQGVLFETVVANSPWTLPSHASMLTGLDPRRHGLKSHLQRLPERVPTLAALLGDAGYATLALVNSQYLSERFGLQRGFEQHEFYPEHERKARIRSAGKQMNRAIEWIGQTQGRPFFLLLHNYDVHSDYDPSGEFAEMFAQPYEGQIRGTSGELRRVRSGRMKLDAGGLQRMIDLYDGGIRQLDSQLERLLRFLDEAGLSDGTFVIVTSDHGEEFLEHGGVLHGRSMYEEILSVPLIVRGPGVPAGVRVRGVVQLTDIFPTVLALARVEAPPGIDGVSLVGSWAGSIAVDPERLAIAEADHQGGNQDDVMRMVRRGAVKLIYDRRTKTTELYDLAEDPAERVDLSERRPDTVRELIRALRSYDSGPTPAQPISRLSPEEIEDLRSLGYVD